MVFRGDKWTRAGEMILLREQGLTYAEIGRRFGISREGVRRIIKGLYPKPKIPLESKLMLSTSDVARLLGLHPNTVRRWTQEGVLKAYRLGGRGDRRYQRQDIEEFLSLHKE